MRDVIRHLIKILETGGEAIVCQVVETRGSTPQKAGSMMIVDPDGGQGGTLGGGCVENEVKTKAMQQLASGAAAVHSFVLDHDYAWADGLICGGRMVVIAQPVRGPVPLEYFRSIDRFLGDGHGFTEAIVLDPDQAGGAVRRQSLPLRRRRLPDGLPAIGSGSRRAFFANRKAGHSTQTGGPERDRIPAKLAAHPAYCRRCGPCRAGGRRARRASRFRRLGRRRPQAVRQ